MVHEAYDSPVFSSYPSFPLEGKCHEEAKGCTRQSIEVALHRCPDRQSAACVIWASYPWTCLRHVQGLTGLRPPVIVPPPAGGRWYAVPKGERVLRVLKFDGLSGRGLWWRLRRRFLKKGGGWRRGYAEPFCPGGGEKGSYVQKAIKKELPKEFSFFILIRMRSSVRRPRCRRDLQCCRMLWLQSCSKRPVLRSSGVLRLRGLPRSERRTSFPSRNPAGR